MRVSDDHSLSLDGMVHLLVAGGYLKCDMEGSLVMAKDPPSVPLEFYWVVPYGIEAKWKRKAQQKYTAKEKTAGDKLSEKKKVLNACLEKHIQQFVLIMDKESPALPKDLTSSSV